MIYKASELLARLRLLTLVGVEDGELLWMGKDKDFRHVEMEEMAIMHDYQLSKI